MQTFSSQIRLFNFVLLPIAKVGHGISDTLDSEKACAGGSYSATMGTQMNNPANTMDNCTSACEADIGCFVVTWCPFCKPAKCLLFTKCDTWSRDPIDPKAGNQGVDGNICSVIAIYYP